MRGYKAVNPDMTCRGFQYEVGKTYCTDEPIGLCERGFHFCKKISDPFEYYSQDARLFEVEASGAIIEGVDKCVCSEIRFISEITGQRKTLAICDDGYGNIYGKGDGYENGYGGRNGNGDGRGYDYGRDYGYGNGFGDGTGDGRIHSYVRSYDNGYGFGDGNGCGYGNNIHKILNIKEG